MFTIADLNKRDQERFKFVEERIQALQTIRQQPHYGVYLETLWADADKDYIPHRLKSKSKKVLVQDEDKGWRGTANYVNLSDSNWQSDISQVNPFIKISTALAILVDQNPSGVFTAASKQYQATSELMKQLYQRSWEYAKSKEQLKLFVFNLAKYGWACARTYPKRVVRDVSVLTEYNAEDPSKSVYEEKEVVEYNDIFRENLDPRNVWIDDMARPNNTMSIRDWCWRKVYTIEMAEQEFGKSKLWKKVQPGGVTTETINLRGKKTPDKVMQEKDLLEVKFYESVEKDLFMVIANGIPVVISPLPVSDAKGNKKLSLWQAYWQLRHAESIYGIGIYEAIRYDQAMLDRVRNMTADQLVLSIYKMFFYQGTQKLTETGDMTITPGRGRQVLDPKNINWLDVPGPGKDAYTGLAMFKKDLDDASGITPPIAGEVTGKTAFEIAQAKESALKRLKLPLDNILDALNHEGYITVSLIQLLYSIPETFKIADFDLMNAYLQEIQGDPELYERDEEDQFFAKVYREFPLNLDTDEEGNLTETKDTRFFRVKPSGLPWEGIINIKAQSLLTPSKEIDKALELEMYNLLIPLLMQPPEIYAKVAKGITKLYDKDPKEILPDMWLQDNIPMGVNQPLIVPADQAGVPMPMSGGAPRMVSSVQGPQNPRSLAGKISARATKLNRLL